MMHRFILLIAICLSCAACGREPTIDELNPPDAPVIPPGRSAENSALPIHPSGSAIPNR
jgi:hypothetical protein